MHLGSASEAAQEALGKVVSEWCTNEPSKKLKLGGGDIFIVIQSGAEKANCMTQALGEKTSVWSEEHKKK